MPAADQIPENQADRLRAVTGKIQTAFLDYGGRIKRANRIAKVILVVVGAALAGWGQFAPDPYVAIGRLVGVTGVFLAFIGGLWSFVVDDSAANLMSEAQTAIDEATAISAELASLKIQIEREREQFDEERLDYEDDLGVISQLYTTSAALREFVENEVVRYDGNIAKTMQKLLDMVARQIHELLAFNGVLLPNSTSSFVGSLGSGMNTISTSSKAPGIANLLKCPSNKAYSQQKASS